MVWPAVIMAAAGLAGAGLSYYGGQQANAASRSAANAQMAFQNIETAEARAFAMEQREAQEHFGREMTTWEQNFARESAGRQEAFQRETLNSAQAYNTMMSNTAFQRSVADMKAAGLNPMLAYTQGGATSPTTSGASGAAMHAGGASGSAPTVGAPSGASYRAENTLSGAVSSATQLARIGLELDQLQANVDQTKATTALNNVQQDQVRANTAVETARAVTEGVRPDLIRAQTRTEEGRPALLGAQTAQAGASARLTGEQAQQYERYGPPSWLGSLFGLGEAVTRRVQPHVTFGEGNRPPGERQPSWMDRWQAEPGSWIHRLREYLR